MRGQQKREKRELADFWANTSAWKRNAHLQHTPTTANVKHLGMGNCWLLDGAPNHCQLVEWYLHGPVNARACACQCAEKWPCGSRSCDWWIRLETTVDDERGRPKGSHTWSGRYEGQAKGTSGIFKFWNNFAEFLVQLVLELGTFLGYSSTRIAANTPADTKIFTVEPNNESAVCTFCISMHFLGANIFCLGCG